VNEQGGVETKVETVDYRKSAGHDGEPPKKEDVEVIHRTDAEGKPGVLEGGVETKVETVDYRTSAGHDGEPPEKEDVEVIHRTDAEEKPGVLAKAAEAVGAKIQSAKEAASNIGKSGK